MNKLVWAQMAAGLILLLVIAHFAGATASLRAWITARRERRAIQSYAEGYRYAAGALLAGDTIETLHQLTDTARSHGDFTPFDRGVEQACIVWTAKMRRMNRRARV